MRVAVANWHSSVVGGAESYIKGVVTALESAGVELAMLSERESATDRESIELSAGAPTWCVSEIGEQAALAAMRAWRPDVVYVHLIESPALEAQLLEVAPAVLFAHSYHGMCISGEKTFKFPDVRPCGLPFGWKCLLHFYPHRCGGLSPITMWRDYLKQSERHSILPKYSAIATGSEHLRRELIANGVKPERVHKIPMMLSATFAEPGNQRCVARRWYETNNICRATGSAEGCGNFTRLDAGGCCRAELADQSDFHWRRAWANGMGRTCAPRASPRRANQHPDGWMEETRRNPLSAG